VSFFKRYLWDSLLENISGHGSCTFSWLTTSNQWIFSRNGFILKKSLRGFAKAFCFGSNNLLQTLTSNLEAKECNYRKILPLRQIAAIPGNTWNIRYWKRIFSSPKLADFLRQNFQISQRFLFGNIYPYNGWICPDFFIISDTVQLDGSSWN